MSALRNIAPLTENKAFKRRRRGRGRGGRRRRARWRRGQGPRSFHRGRQVGHGEPCRACCCSCTPFWLGSRQALYRACFVGQLGSRRARFCASFVGSDPTIHLLLIPRPVSDGAGVVSLWDYQRVALQCCDHAEVDIARVALQQIGREMTSLEHFGIISGSDFGEQLTQPGPGAFGRLRFLGVTPVKDSSRHPLASPLLRCL